MKNNQVVIIILVAVLGLGLGFYGGTKYQQMQRAMMTGRSNLQAGQPGNANRGGQRGQGNFRGGNAVAGEIISISDSSITVKLADGSSKIVLLGASTPINKESAGARTDLTMGTKVAVFGTTNSDGSVTAQTVQINPTMGMAGMMLGGKPKNTGTKSADAKEIIVTGQNFSFSPNSITVPVGQKTRIVFKSVGGVHDFVVDELSIKTATVQTDDSDWVEFTPAKAGSYQFYCSVGNHKAMGMVGTLLVQ